jgi:hypothetical protein
VRLLPGWHRVDHQSGEGPEASSICYYRAPRDCVNGVYSYVLTFTHVFTHDRDTVYFASCFPYTYTGEWAFLGLIARAHTQCPRHVDLQQVLGKLCKSVPSFIHVDRTAVCKFAPLRLPHGHFCFPPDSFV